MRFTDRNILLAISGLSAAAMLYVGAYQVRAVEHLSCPVFGHGCEAVADAPFARPFGIPDGFIGAGLYALLIGVALLNPQVAWVKYSVRGVAVLAGVANILGVIDMARFGAYCFYCLLTTALTPFLLWKAFLL
ncbi:MAG: vitamin K epoxide reductase family protein [Bryobacteraceae bacterium]